MYQAKVASELSKRAGQVLGLPKIRDTRLFKKEYCMELGTLGVIDENDFTENMKTNDVFRDNEEYSEFRQSGASAVGYEEIGGPREYRRSQTNINNQ